MTSMNNYALRLQTSLLNELRQVAREESTSINQLINVAVAEKLAALRTESYFRQRMNQASREEFMAILEKAGTDIALEGDELPPT